ncbi:hypothetical protein PC128_g23351 [Phytophthora cactorum]|nr:hypothetical protein PC120_g24640 [Phytophthora cactorum]KAG3043102.1 hypothetical protein PC121_g22758 [Phytophthora cactorum]KAG3149782.1 hypothetical protein PC128_g23351 [Phytophthora cactorum]KAG4039240.1 hypothetical protein PC123_g25206 [Phytophthora cactorum]
MRACVAPRATIISRNAAPVSSLQQSTNVAHAWLREFWVTVRATMTLLPRVPRQRSNQLLISASLNSLMTPLQS